MLKTQLTKMSQVRHTPHSHAPVQEMPNTGPRGQAVRPAAPEGQERGQSVQPAKPAATNISEKGQTSKFHGLLLIRTEAAFCCSAESGT